MFRVNGSLVRPLVQVKIGMYSYAWVRSTVIRPGAHVVVITRTSDLPENILRGVSPVLRLCTPHCYLPGFKKRIHPDRVRSVYS